MMQPAQKSYLNIPDNRWSRWQHIQKVRQDFWILWQKEYLTELQRKQKWTTGDETIKKGTLILLKEDHLPPLQWVIGRVQEVHPGPDGEIRVITVKIAKGQYKWSVRDVLYQWMMSQNNFIFIISINLVLFHLLMFIFIYILIISLLSSLFTLFIH